MNDPFDRQRRIPEIDQERLQAGRVLVLGAGALGNVVLTQLAMAGVGRISIVDLDQVEDTNLHRMPLFRASDVGAFKAVVAGQRMRELAPNVRVKVHNGDLRFSVGLGVFRTADVVLGCLDSIGARVAATRACALAGTPYIDGATAGLTGEVRYYRADEGPCYECSMDAEARAAMWTRWSCSELPRSSEGRETIRAAVGAASSVVGSHQALGALLALSGQLECWGTVHVYNGRIGRMGAVRLKRNPACGNHDAMPTMEQWREGRAQDSTPAAAARAFSGVAIRLPHAFATAMRCPRGHRETIERPLAALDASLAACPLCGAEREPVTVLGVGPDQPEWNRTFSELGVPPGDAFMVISKPKARSEAQPSEGPLSAEGASTTWVELTGDLEDQW